MVKKIKFNLLVEGNSIGDFEQLQDNFSADLLDHIKNKKLYKWFSVRDMDDKAQQVFEIDLNASPMEQMKLLCRILELEEDEDVITYLLEEKEKRQKEQTIRQELTVSSKTSVEESDESDDTDGSENNPRGEDWSERDFSGRDFTGADLRGYNLFGVNFTNANLTDANLSGCDLSKAILDRAILSNTNFNNCCLIEAKITSVLKREVWEVVGHVWYSTKRGSYYRGEDINLSKLNGYKGPDFSNAKLDKSILSGNFTNANFKNSRAHEVDASSARFIDAVLNNADFSLSTLPESEDRLSEEQKKEAKMFGVKFVDRYDDEKPEGYLQYIK